MGNLETRLPSAYHLEERHALIVPGTHTRRIAVPADEPDMFFMCTEGNTILRSDWSGNSKEICTLSLPHNNKVVSLGCDRTHVYAAVQGPSEPDYDASFSMYWDYNVLSERSCWDCPNIESLFEDPISGKILSLPFRHREPLTQLRTHYVDKGIFSWHPKFNSRGNYAEFVFTDQYTTFESALFFSNGRHRDWSCGYVEQLRNREPDSLEALQISHSKTGTGLIIKMEDTLIHPHSNPFTWYPTVMEFSRVNNKLHVLYGGTRTHNGEKKEFSRTIASFDIQLLYNTQLAIDSD